MLPAGSVAVALMKWVNGTAVNVTENEASPNASVVTVMSPMNVSPSPKVEGSATTLSKNR